MTERTLDEQFAALPDRIKGKMFRLLDVALDATQEEKMLAEQILGGMAAAETPAPVPALMRSLSQLMMWVRIEAEPKGGE